MNVIYASSEVLPFAKTGGLADVAGTLPKALIEVAPCDARVITPLYRITKDKKFDLRKVKTISTKMFLHDIPRFDLYECEYNGFITYFIEFDQYYDRDELYATQEGDYGDNAYRFSFFSKAVLAALNEIGWIPDVIHANEWHTALIPFYKRFGIRAPNPFAGTKVLFTIHNMAYQGIFDRAVLRGISIPDEFFTMDGLNFYGKVNFLKSGILYSDAINTVSKGYAREIMTAEHGWGLDGLLRTRRSDLFGILNGADYKTWDPATDPLIPANYDGCDPSNKYVCRKRLLEAIGLTLSDDKPLFGAITRLVEQKGIDLIIRVIKDIVAMKSCMVILGTGDARFQRQLEALAKRYPSNVSIRMAFDNKLAHMIEAGSDIFLMPSKYEPCGLSQIYSLKYGTIPIVRATGGLDDTIMDYDKSEERGNGFKFKEIDADEFIDAIMRAAKVFEEKERWQALVKRAMACDFSWERSAREYIALYDRLIYSYK